MPEPSFDAADPADFDPTLDPSLRSWVESANDPATDFPIQNLPFGTAQLRGADQPPFPCVAIGDQVVNLLELFEAGLLLESTGDADEDSMSEVALVAPWTEPDVWSVVRERLVELLSVGNRELRDHKKARALALRPMSACDMLVPNDFIGNYTDFYASIHHASNVGAMFRPDNALLPNYKHVPIGYHGRASSIVVSGTEVRRPRGQTKADDAPAPSFGPCKMLDYELELGLWVAEGSDLGEPVPIGEAEYKLFGACLLNDWSARDIQKWEYQPLGPFLAKNFGTSVSPWIVTMEALAPFRVPAAKRPEGDPRPLDYLWDERDQRSGGLDVRLEVFLASAQMRERKMAPIKLSTGHTRDLYWTPAQLIAHHTSNGCNLDPGDLIGSGTVSGPTPDSRGCLLELTWGGSSQPRKPVDLPTGEKRTFLEDGDEVIFKGWCEREGFRRIGFGECRGMVLPARGQ